MPDELSSIVFASTDSTTFIYHCDAKKEDFVAFVFKIIIKNNKEETFYTTNKTVISFKGLPESVYLLRIEAFAPQKKWNAVPLEISFEVNNKYAAVVKRSKQLKDSITKNSLKKEEIQQSDSLNKSYFIDVFKNYYYIFVIAIVAFFLAIIVLRKKSKNSKKPKRNIRISNMADDTLITVPKIQIDRFQVENSNLKAEIVALRGQIDALQLRSRDMYVQNKELKDHIDRLSKSKVELEELQTQKDDLFAVVIHDIKNPAALIKSLVELLRSYDLTASEQQEVINDIFETTKKIVSLSQEVTRILSLESNFINLNLDKVDLRDIIKDVQKRNTISATNKSISVLLDLAEDIPETYMDYQKIDEVLDNLISNAIKFSHSGGKVRILSKIKEDHLVVEISDNGLGLSEEDITQAFQRGVKLSAQPTGGEHSSGFGLWIVKKLIEAHKGSVWVKSTLGKGSTFAFSIPMIFEINDPAE